MNEHSSRSHCVFMLDCKCSHKNGTVMEGHYQFSSLKFYRAFQIHFNLIMTLLLHSDLAILCHLVLLYISFLLYLGGLKLVDLAGSERLSRTGTLNDSVRLKESVNINKSLSSLSDVFTALAKKQSHVPYRNSKLTLLLQVALFTACLRT